MPEIDRERLLKGLQGEERLLGALLLDKAAEALDKGCPAVTDFLDPAGRALADDLLKYIEGLRVMTFGGHRRLERVRLVLLPHYYLEATVTAGDRHRNRGRFNEVFRIDVLYDWLWLALYIETS